jgi:hypothetical protein
MDLSGQVPLGARAAVAHADGDSLRSQLDQWVLAGLISDEQAHRIALREGLAPAPPASADALASTPTVTSAGVRFLAQGRSGYAVEALGYLGGTLAVIAGFIAVGQLWPDIPTWAEIGFAAAGALLLVVAGTLARPGRDPSLHRLRSVLWALSSSCVVAVLVMLGTDVLELRGISTAVVASAAAAAYSAVLWRLSPTPVQLAVLFAATATLAGTGVARLDDDLTPWSSGVAVWLASALWILLSVRRVLTPESTGAAVGSIGLIVGAQLTMDHAAGDVLALATIATLLAAGVVVRKVWLLGVGAIGVLQVVPQVAMRYLPETVAAPLAILVVGLVLLSIALWLARHGRRKTDAR